MDWAYLVQLLGTTVMLTHVAISDLRKREVKDLVWLIYSPLLILVYFERGSFSPLIYAYTIAATSLTTFAMYKFGLMGGADVIGAAMVSALNPSVSPLFFPLLSRAGMDGLVVLLYTSLMIALTGLWNLFRNLRYTSGLPFMKRLSLAFSGRRVTVSQFINSKFLFPLTEDPVSQELRTTFSIEEDDSQWREKFRRMLAEGKVREDTMIWVTWGVPVLTFMLFAYLLSLLIGLPV